MVGEVIGLLTVEAYAGYRKENHEWELRCVCGETVFRTTSEIRRGQKSGRQSACAGCARSLGHRRMLEALGKREAGPTGRHCPSCYGLPHRRPKSGCRECREPFAVEVVEHVIPTGGCGLGLVIV
jgi:hypothetical protein